MKFIKRWRAYVGPKDERIEAESNRIYKTGFIMLSIGLLVYLYYGGALKQAVFARDMMESGSGSMTITLPDLFITGWFMLTMIVCLALQWRKGFADDASRFAETDEFPRGYFGLVSCLVGLGVGLLASIVRIAAELQVLGPEGVMWLEIGVTGIMLAFATLAICWLAFYMSFCIARSRRETLEARLND